LLARWQVTSSAPTRGAFAWLPSGEKPFISPNPANRNTPHLPEMKREYHIIFLPVVGKFTPQGDCMNLTVMER
jgi:hypothetical protein